MALVSNIDKSILPATEYYSLKFTAFLCCLEFWWETRQGFRRISRRKGRNSVRGSRGYTPSLCFLLAFAYTAQSWYTTQILNGWTAKSQSLLLFEFFFGQHHVRKLGLCKAYHKNGLPYVSHARISALRPEIRIPPVAHQLRPKVILALFYSVITLTSCTWFICLLVPWLPSSVLHNVIKRTNN